MSIKDLKKENNPNIIDIVGLYITNMAILRSDPRGYENINKVFDLISQKRTQIFNLSKKMKDAKILEVYDKTSKKNNYIQLNKIETMIRNALYDAFKRSITDTNGRLDIEKFKKNFADFAEDEEIKQLVSRVVQSGGYTGERRVISRLNKGSTETVDEGYKENLDTLAGKMVEKALGDFETYEGYIYVAYDPIDLNEVYSNLNSYFQDQISSMQGFYLEYGPTTPIR